MPSVRSVLDKLQPFLLPLIITVTLAVFSPVAWHDFINFDDDVFVYENPAVLNGLTLDGVRWAFTTGHEVNWIPLSWLSHMLDIELFGLNPAGHHLVNVLLHAGSSGLLFVFLKRATSAPWRSAFVALLFALHPLHVESVAWVAERKDVLSGFFGMLTLIAYVRYAERPGPARYIATLVLFLLGLMSKPMLVTLPVVLLLLDYWPLGRLREGLDSGRPGAVKLITEKVPFFVLSVGSSIVTFLVQETGGQLTQGYTLLSRMGKACIAYVTYLVKMVWPTDLAILYPFPKYQPSSAKMIVCCVLVLMVTAIIIWQRKRSPYLVTGWFWYLVTLLPVIGLIQIGQHFIADRYTYIPLIGIFVILAWGVPDLLAGVAERESFLAGLAAAVLVTLVVLTSVQLRYWQNGFTVFTRAVAVTTDNWVALNNLGLIHLRARRLDEAARYFNESLKAKPTYMYAHLNLGAVYLVKGEYEKAIESYNWALRFDPNNPKAHNGLGISYLKTGQRERALEQQKFLEELGSPLAYDLLDMITGKKEVLF